MTKNKVLFPLAAAALLAVSLPQASRASSIVYSIVDYPGLESGWTVSGTITTDGTIGTLNVSDITAWSFTFTKAGTTDTWTSAGNGSNAAVTQEGGLTATATELEAGTPGALAFSYLILGYTTPNGAGQLEWDRQGSVGPQSASDTYQGVFSSQNLFINGVKNPPGLTLTDSTNWVIAEVQSQSSSSSAPEPGTAGLFALGVAGLAVARARRTA